MVFQIVKVLHEYSKSVRVTPQCLDEEKEVKYMNSPQVRDALHIPKGVQSWDVCRYMKYLIVKIFAH